MNQSARAFPANRGLRGFDFNDEIAPRFHLQAARCLVARREILPVVAHPLADRRLWNAMLSTDFPQTGALRQAAAHLVGEFPPIPCLSHLPVCFLFLLSY